MKQQHLQSSLLIPLLEQESAGRKVMEQQGMGSGHTHRAASEAQLLSPQQFQLPDEFDTQ